MTQSRVNSQVNSHYHKEGTDKLDRAAVANEFVSKNDTRRLIFGRFSAKDFA